MLVYLFWLYVGLIIIFSLEWQLRLLTYDAWGRHVGCCSRCKLLTLLSSQVFITTMAITIPLCYRLIMNRLSLFITPSILLITLTTPQNYHLNAQIHTLPLLSPSHPLSYQKPTLLCIFLDKIHKFLDWNIIRWLF